MSKKSLLVGFQGEPGAYSEMAALKVGKPISFFSFEALFESVIENKIQVAVVPIENAVAGSVTEVVDLLFRHYKTIEILSEITLSISHCLMGNQGASIKTATKVLSHWQALRQCKSLFNKYPTLNAVETYDTAGSAKLLKDSGDMFTLAIASERAATLYVLKIVKRNVSDVRWNKTRFFLIKNKDQPLSLKKSEAQSKNKSLILAPNLSWLKDSSLEVVRVFPCPTGIKPFDMKYLMEIKGAVSKNGCSSLGTYTEWN